MVNLRGDIDPEQARVIATGTTEDGKFFSATLAYQGDGVFRVENVPAGEYEVEAFPMREGEDDGG